MFEQLGKLTQSWAASRSPWTNVYGLARTLLALGTLTTLAFSHSTSIFAPAVGMENPPACGGVTTWGLFCQMPAYLEVARWIAVGILLVVASGWRPRFTGLLHWWVSFSLFTSGVLVDGGDQITMVLTLLLLPVTLTDSRKWHWQPTPEVAAGSTSIYKQLLALSAFLAIRLQVAGVYFHASVGKFKVEEWANGTAMYYWLTDPSFGVPDWLAPVMMPILTNGVTVVLLTWSVLVLEVMLFMALTMPKRHWHKMLIAGLFFHSGIAVFQGLTSFALAMFAALILFLRPVEQPFNFAGAYTRLRAHDLRLKLPAPAPPPPVLTPVEA